MSHNEDNTSDQIPSDLAARLDRACDAFEAAWKAGDRPRIEDLLQSSPEDGRNVLLCELLSVELQLRKAARETPQKAEYISRFPAFAEEIDRAFEIANVSDAPPTNHNRTASGDRNLLFGILALQMDFITRDALVAAMNAWVLAKEKSLGQILVEQQAMPQANYDLLAPLVDAHIRQHNNDPQQSLAAVSSLSDAVGDLRSIADADVHASLERVSAARAANDPWKTMPQSVGSETSAGTRFHILRPHAEGGLGIVFDRPRRGARSRGGAEGNQAALRGSRGQPRPFSAGGRGHRRPGAS